MARFIQLIAFEASDIEAVQAALERFRDEYPGRSHLDGINHDGRP